MHTAKGSASLTAKGRQTSRPRAQLPAVGALRVLGRSPGQEKWGAGLVSVSGRGSGGTRTLLAPFQELYFLRRNQRPGRSVAQAELRPTSAFHDRPG